MALSDLAVFSEYAYDAMTEVLRQQIDLFNGASQGTITLQAAAHQGDYSDRAFYAKVDGLIRRRDAYGSGPVAGKSLSHLIDTMVKIASGTPPVSLNPGQFRWIQRNPEEAGAALGQQLARDALADMLNTGVMIAYAAMSNDADEVAYDGTAAAMDPKNFVRASRKFGDNAGRILAWVSHSGPLFDMYESNMSNEAALFNYGSVIIQRDPFGRPFIISDSPSLVEADGVAADVDRYHTLGLVSDALVIHQNNDFDDNFEKKNGDENLLRTYQAEWSYNVGVRGYSWNKSSASPTDAALGSAANWERYATDTKDLAGVIIESR